MKPLSDAQHEALGRKALTSVQRRALGLAQRKGGAPTGTAKGTIRVQVARVLLEREWVTITNAIVLITRAGRAKLNEPIPDVPVLLRQRDGLTTRPELSVRGEPEVTDPATLESFWIAQAAARREGAQCPRSRSKGISRSLREAA
jgi:hypothetical protein